MKRISFFTGRVFVLIALISCCFASSGQTYIVTSMADDGTPGTLRDAITKVNTGADNVIDFDFSLFGAGPYTITLFSDLPTLAAPGAVLINGYSEPSSVAGTISARSITVQIDGALTATKGLDLNSSNVTICGLAIYNIGNSRVFPTPIPGTAINVHAGINNIFIWGNFIGTNATGTAAGFYNANAGIQVGVSGSATASTGIIVGTNGDGTTDANEGNLLVGNGPYPPASPGFNDGGIIVFNTNHSRFSGNIIGLDLNGVSSGNLINNGSGILLSDRSTNNIVGTNGDGMGDNNEGNTISFNVLYGIWVLSRSNSNLIAGNSIGGVDVNEIDVSNGSFGVNIDNSSNNLIGTNADGVSEVFKPNRFSNISGDIQIKSGNSTSANQNADNNIIAGNYIPQGITIISYTSPFTSDNNIIGSDGSGINEQYKPNTIGYQYFNGVGVTINDLTNTTLAVGNRISRNTIVAGNTCCAGRGNGTIGIDLVNSGQIGTTGVTPNHGAGLRNGPNGLLNFPVITAASASGTNITISGFAKPGAILEFFVADRGSGIPAPTSPLLRNFGEGQTFLFQAVQGGTLNGITDNGTNVAGSYSDIQEGLPANSGTDPITTDYTFSYTIPAASVGITRGMYALTAVAIDKGNSSGNVNNTSAFGPDLDADFTSLPITLIDFTGHESEGVVYLNWSTSREVNNIVFYIQRSTDGIRFSNIGQEAGSITTDQVKNYEFTDANPLPGVSFYRLKQVDIDGRFSYSKIITIRNDLTTGAIKIFPSPFHENLNISINALRPDQLHITIVDQTGRIVSSQQINVTAGINSFNIGSGLGNLNSGVFIIEVSGETIYYKQKLIRN